MAYDHSLRFFKPSAWLCNPHLQTVIGSIQKPSKLASPKTYEIAIDARRKSLCKLYAQNSATLVLLFHGLGGTTESTYITRTAHSLWKQGFDVACISLPGNQESSPYLYHAGDSDIFPPILDHFDHSYSNTYWVGFSFSGNLLLHWLQNLQRISGALAISPVTDLKKSVLAIDAPSQWIYRKYFLAKLIALLHAKNQQHPKTFQPLMKATSARTIEEFDTLFTCPFHGYPTPDQYYRVNSCVDHLHSIQNDTTIIYAKDDPFLSPQDFQHQALEQNKKLQILPTLFGGHVGFFQSFSQGFQYPHWISQHIIHATTP